MICLYCAGGEGDINIEHANLIKISQKLLSQSKGDVLYNSSQFIRAF